MKIKINVTMGRHKAGTIIEVQDMNGKPIENFWRRRLRDSVFDNCCEIVKDKKVKLVTNKDEE